MSEKESLVIVELDAELAKLRAENLALQQRVENAEKLLSMVKESLRSAPFVGASACVNDLANALYLAEQEGK